MHKGTATFTLDYGTCPPWLYERMVKLGRAMTEVIVDEFGPEEYIKRIADPVWFQALGTVLAFDWNASGLTTILTAALKEAIRGQEKDLGIFVAGGKGKTSKRTPEEIQFWGEQLGVVGYTTDTLVYNSKMAAKVDSALVQDGYQIYHHAFFFTRNGSWTVVQQGMNTDSQTARRYHWHDKARGKPREKTGEKRLDLINEPHAGIASQLFDQTTLNLTSEKSSKTRDLSTELLNANYESLLKDIRILRKYSSNLSKSITLKSGDEQLSLLQLSDEHFTTHPVIHEDFAKSKYLDKILRKVADQKPDSYENFVAIEGVGPLTVRALSLVAEVIYGAPPSYEDPARYSFAHGGKDKIPYPVDKETYDTTIATLEHLVEKSRLPVAEKDTVLKRLTRPA